jgi:hypothetical protein
LLTGDIDKNLAHRARAPCSLLHRFHEQVNQSLDVA